MANEETRVIEHNTKCINNRKRDRMLPSIKLPKYEFSKLSQEVYITIDTPIIAIKNLKDNFVNSERFVISDIDRDEQIITIYNKNRGHVDVPIAKVLEELPCCILCDNA
jgi:hypothetical protein